MQIQPSQIPAIKSQVSALLANRDALRVALFVQTLDAEGYVPAVIAEITGLSVSQVRQCLAQAEACRAAFSVQVPSAPTMPAPPTLPAPSADYAAARQVGTAAAEIGAALGAGIVGLAGGLVVGALRGLAGAFSETPAPAQAPPPKKSGVTVHNYAGGTVNVF